MNRLFRPESVAVIGASQKSGTVGAAIMRNLIHGRYTGAVYPVSGDEKKIWDLPAWPRASAIDHDVDLAVLAVAAAALPRAVRECAEAGISRMVLVSSGSRDISDTGRALESRIRAEADLTGVRLIGPNAMGFSCPHGSLHVSSARHRPEPGAIAFISQSSTIAAAILDLSLRERIGFSHFISLGAMMDVDFADIIDHLGNDPKVGSIVLYLEHLRKLRPFMSAARAVARVKPIIALKAQRLEEDTPVPGITTDAAWDAALGRAGIVRVDTFEELFDCAELLGKQRRPSGEALAILTNGCGPGVMAMDAMDRYGLAPATLPPETKAALAELLPAPSPNAGYVDLLADATPERYARAAEICLQAAEVNALLIILSPHLIARPEAVAAHLATTLAESVKPVFTSWMGGTAVEESRRLFNEAGIATFDTPERAVRAFNNLLRHRQNVATLQQIPSRLPRKLAFDTAAARRRLKGVLDTRGQTPTPETTLAVLDAYGIAPSAEEGPMTASPLMLAVGAHHRPLFGPVLYLGPGGDMTDIAQKRSLALPPLNRLLARRMIEASPVHRLFDRFAPARAHVETFLEEVLIRLGQLVTDFPEIVSVSINPLAVSADGARAVHADMGLAPAPVPAPMHLVISPYPRQYETRTVARNRTPLLIRPIRPEDAPLLEQHFAALSPRSVYRRFFTPLRQLSPQLLARFTQIDYDREIALVALSQESMGAKRLAGRGPNHLRKDRPTAPNSRWWWPMPGRARASGAALLQRMPGHCPRKRRIDPRFRHRFWLKTPKCSPWEENSAFGVQTYSPEHRNTN